LTWPACVVHTATSGAEALQLFAEVGPDLVVLDIQMPPPDGFAVCQRIRETSQAPILILTGHDNTPDKVRALDLGADDYLTKPFDHLELLARLRALVRRGQEAQTPPNAELSVGSIALNVASHEVRVRGETVRLTSTEYRLLEEFMRNPGATLGHHHLLRRVWGQEYAGNAHYLKVFVRRLRQKLGDTAAHPRYIEAVWGVGYRFLPANDR
jgi:DNA-binding response OmpR family regulator